MMTFDEKIAKAEAVLEKAQLDLSRLRQEKFAVDVRAAFKELNRCLWKHRMAGESSLQSPLVEISKKINEAVTLFNKQTSSPDYIMPLIELDSDRWDESDYRYVYDLDTAAYSVSTWLFDHFGYADCRQGSPLGTDTFSTAEKATVRARLDVLPPELAEAGFTYWEEGRHDT
jgi:hypothetical protein